MFNILNILDRLHIRKKHSSWIEAECPVCQGKLKISTSPYREGSYACYTNWCHEIKNARGWNLIRQNLDTYTPFTAQSRFTTTRLFESPEQLVPTSIPITEQINLKSNAIYKRPAVTTVNKKKRNIVFEYAEFRYVRVETWDDCSVSKYFYPLHKPEGEDIYVKGIPPLLSFPVYREEYIQPDIVIVEGEKCASFLQKRGIAAVSVYPPYAQSHLLKDIILEFRNRGVRNILYLPDNDTPGYKKATHLLHEAWRLGIAATSLPMITLYPQYKDYQGLDIVDLYNLESLDSQAVILQSLYRGLYG